MFDRTVVSPTKCWKWRFFRYITKLRMVYVTFVRFRGNLTTSNKFKTEYDRTHSVRSFVVKPSQQKSVQVWYWYSFKGHIQVRDIKNVAVTIKSQKLTVYSKIHVLNCLIFIIWNKADLRISDLWTMYKNFYFLISIFSIYIIEILCNPFNGLKIWK